MKKTLAIIISALLVFSTFAVFASAESTNILAGKDYTLSGCGVKTTYYADLTDGVAADNLATEDNNANWFGFYCNGDDQSIINAPDKVGYAIFDLEGAYNIDKVRANLICNASWGIGAPDSVNVYVSDDGENWTEAGSFEYTLVDGVAYYAEITGEWTAKFLKVEFVLAGTFAFVNEIEAYGVAATDDEASSDDTSSDDASSDDASSDDASSDDASSDDASSDDASSDDASSDDASSDDASSDDASSDDASSDDASSDDASSDVVLVSKNVALGKTYTTSALYGKPDYPDEGGATLTDGKYPAEGKFNDPAFAGFNKNTDDVKANGYSSIVVDLGEIYNLDKFVVSTGSKMLSSGIGAPAGIEVYVSSDNENWTKAGEAAYVDSDTVAYVDATVALEEAVDARYVQYRVLPHTEAGTAAWMFVCEVQAFANVEGTADDVTPPAPSNPVKPGDASNSVVFVLIALIAMAGTAVVIKNRK